MKLGKVLLAVATGGATAVLEKGKESRAALKTAVLDAETKNAIVSYQFTKTDRNEIPMYDRTWRRDEAIRFGSGLKEGLYIQVGPDRYASTGTYIWASMQRDVIFNGVPIATAEAKYGNQLKYEALDLSGDFDWKLIGKQTLLGILALGATVVSGGIAAAPAWAAAYTGAKKLEKVTFNNMAVDKIIEPVVTTPVIDPVVLQGMKADAAKEASGTLEAKAGVGGVFALVVICVVVYWLVKRMAS